MNTLLVGDCLHLLPTLEGEGIDLIATDPPFNTGKDWGAYNDKWQWNAERIGEYDSLRPYALVRDAIGLAKHAHSEGMGAFLCFMSVRLLAMHRVLKPSGSIYVHCDQTANSYIRMIMDCIFGAKNFRNEIIWKRCNGGKGSQHAAGKYGMVVDSLFFYTKSDDYYLNVKKDLTDDELLSKFPKYDAIREERYNTATPIFCSKSMGSRPNLCYEWNGVSNPHPSGWRMKKSRLQEEYEKGNVVIRDDGRIERRTYASDYAGEPIDNLWEDIPFLVGSSSERTGHPTQKPIALYERIIKASCPTGGIVLDPFAGCATTCVAAERLGCQWVGMDINPDAVALGRRRLI